MTTYPSGQISRYGRSLAEEGYDAWITLVAPEDEHTFYLAGPLAPLPGCQAGFALTKPPTGLHPAFNHLDYRGARQDGVGWADTVYDPAEIILEGEVTGRTVAETREVTRNLIASLDPKKQCILSWTTPAMGEWWAKVRLFRAPGEGLMHPRHRRLPLKLSIRNDDAFWRSTDSVSKFAIADGDQVASDDFNRADDSGVNGLGSDWTQSYDTTPGAGNLGIKSSSVFWYEAGSSANACRARHDISSETDYQVVSFRTDGLYYLAAGAGGYLDLLARIGDSGTTYIRARVGWLTVSLSAFVSGVQVWTTGDVALTAPPFPTETWTLIAGTSVDTPRQYRLLRGDFDVLTATDPAVSSMGASYRQWGFGVAVTATASPTNLPPQIIGSWSAGDNLTINKSGHLRFTNRGTETVYPFYVCYGPGTFVIGNGTGSTGAATPVSFGPLVAGQVAAIDTDPRRKQVIDITPGNAPVATSLQQQFVDSLTSLATTGDITGITNVFRSFFGMIPPQGPLYSLLSGRFTRPIEGHVDGTALVTEQVAVTIEGGNADSKIIGSITPLRRWPE
jgi:hypothetical protein